MTVTASAPGKIVLSGEYAVLWGAPAVCIAVNRRAVASVTPADVFALNTPGFAGEGRYRIIDAVTGGERPDLDVTLDTSAFSENGDKIGIGSSAALTVALSAALGETEDVFEKALAAHQGMQGGSGVDIAAAVHGGLIEYCREPRAIHRLQWPEGLRLRVVWTGVPASTEARLEKLSAAAVHSSRSALLLSAPRMAEAWQSGNVDAILGEYVSYIGVLRQFSIDHDLGIFDAGHDELTDAAMVDGLVYKPAGAGGGDVGVLLGREDAALDAFAARHASLFHSLLECELDNDGVRLDVQ